MYVRAYNVINTEFSLSNLPRCDEAYHLHFYSIVMKDNITLHSKAIDLNEWYVLRTSKV